MKVEYFIAELLLSVGFLFMLLFKGSVVSSSRFIKRYAFFWYAVSLLGLCYSYALFNGVAVHNDLFVIDSSSYLVRFFVLSLGFLVIVFMDQCIDKEKLPSVESYFLVAMQTLGMLVATTCANWISLFVCLELMYLPTYALVCLRVHDRCSQEASCKYVLMGAFSTGLLLYGVSFIYAGVGHFNLLKLADISMLAESSSLSLQNMITGDATAVLMLIGGLFVLVALCFKIGIVPFHLWVRDVYEGGFYFVVALISSAPKLVLLLIWARIFRPNGVFSTQMMAITIFGLGVVSLFFGHLLALVQERIRALFAYSSLGHMGFVLLALGLTTQLGNEVAMTYTFGYAITILCVFLLLGGMMINGREIVLLNDLKGLGAVHPLPALILLVALFSLLGLPPFAGFMLKMRVLSALLQAQYYLLALVTVVPTVIAACYYIRVVNLMYFHTGDDTMMIDCQYSLLQRLCLCGGMVFLVGVGVYPNFLFSLMATFYRL